MPESLRINLQQIINAAFLNILNLLKVPHSQDCNFGMKYKDTDIKRDFVQTIILIRISMFIRGK